MYADTNRKGDADPMFPPPTTSRLIRFAAFEVDLKAGEVRRDGQCLRLQEQPLQVLTMLVEHAGDVVTRDELRGRLWPDDKFVDFDQGLNKAINKIRRALGDFAEHPSCIETLPKRGYRLLAPLHRSGEEPQFSNGQGTANPQATDNHGTDRTRTWRRVIALGGAATLRSILAFFSLGKSLRD